MNSDTQLSVLFQAINALGVVGILGFLVVAFYRGDLVAKSLLDRILAVYEQQLADNDRTHPRTPRNCPAPRRRYENVKFKQMLPLPSKRSDYFSFSNRMLLSVK